MAKKTTPSFIVELRLKTSPDDERLLADRVECGKRLFNTLLHEGFNRLKAMRASNDWALALALPKATPDDKALRLAAFQA